MSENQSFRGRNRQREKIKPKSIAARLENHFKLFLILKKSNGEKKRKRKKAARSRKNCRSKSNEEKETGKKIGQRIAVEKYFLSRSESIDFVV